MASKDKLCMSSFNHKSFINFNNPNHRYTNFNSYQNQKCLNEVQSNSKSLKNNKTFDSENNKEKGNLEVLNQSQYNTLFKEQSSNIQELLNANSNGAKETTKEKPWKYDDNNSDIKNCSTLSLHIAAYESSTEGDETVSYNRNEVLYQNRKYFDSKKAFLGAKFSEIENPFEFPRQQKEETTDPAIMQFKASQKLLNPNQSTITPCSMTSFSSHSNEKYYGIACYEQNSQNEYIGEIVIARSSDLSEIKKIPANGGVFRIYSLPEENSIFAVTTSGDFMFINDQTFDTKVISHPEQPYFTDGSVSTTLLATTDDKGNLHVIDRETKVPLTKVRAHRLRKVGDLECPAWSCSFISDSSSSLVSVGDDGRLCLWDLRESNLKEALFIKGSTDDGMVFVSSKKEKNIVAVGDYAQNYSLYDIRSANKKPIKTIEFPGGVWHIDSFLEDSKGLSAAACMQGGVIVFDSSENSEMKILAHDSDSSLTYGVAIHEDDSDGITVAEVEFDAKKLNRYSLLFKALQD